jgi:thiol-disulfide isomerase/thioredoxin
MKDLIAAACTAALLLSGCDAEVSAPGESKVDVDTPELRELKAQAGIEDCAEGPGGGELPALTLPCLGGGPDVDLSTLRGPMMVNLWGSYCGPCRTEMPVLQEFHQKYGDRVSVLGLDLADKYPGAALELAEATGATYPSLADPGGELLGELRVAGLPSFIWVREDGSYTQSAGGFTSLDDVVRATNQHLGTDL